jgi:uncharacterized protein (DUF983 family)
MSVRSFALYPIWRVTMQIRVRLPFRQVLSNALRLRCPNCRKGSIFADWLNKVKPRCPSCGLRYYRESGYYVGGMILTYISTAFTLLAAYLTTLLLPASNLFSENVRFAMWGLAAILLSIAYVRPAYSLWLSTDFWISPWE